MNAHLHLWLIPALPFVGFLINGLLGRRLPKALVSTVALAFPLAALAVVGVDAFTIYLQATIQQAPACIPCGPGKGFGFLPIVETVGSWINAGPLHIDFSFALDQ